MENFKKFRFWVAGGIIVFLIGGVFFFQTPSYQITSVKEKIDVGEISITAVNYVKGKLQQYDSIIDSGLEFTTDFIRDLLINREIKKLGLSKEDARSVAEKAFQKIITNPYNQDAIESASFSLQVAQKLDPNEAYVYLGFSTLYRVYGYQSGPIFELKSYGEDFLDAAIEYANRAIGLNPELTQAYLTMARLKIIKGDLKTARQFLDLGKKLGPDYFESWYLEGVYSEVSNQPDRAMRFYKEAEKYISLPIHNVFLAYTFARISKKPEGEEKQYKEVIQQAPKKAISYYNYGVFLKGRGRYEEALHQFEKAKKHGNPGLLKYGFSESHYGIGVRLTEQNKLDQAIISFKQALEYDPSSINAFIKLAQCYYATQKWEMGVETMKKAVLKDNSQSGFYYYLGIGYDAQKKNAKALEAFHKAFALEPNNWNISYSLGRAYTLKGDMDSAIKFLKLAETNSDNPGLVYWNLSMAYCRKGQSSQAKETQLNMERIQHPQASTIASYLSQHCPA